MALHSQELLNAMTWRCIGPSRGGRVVAVAGDPVNQAVFYFGAVAGGVWKTTDAGTTWLNISDGYFQSSSVGAMAVSESDPNVIYVGMGETTIRTDVSYGDGVYKSLDSGKTWVHCGLADTRHIGQIRIHPKNPEVVYVAALGHAFGPNEERGVYKSSDGGKTWRKTLFKSDKAGAVDLTFDPNNPSVIYASIWECYRTFWEMSSGGPDSGLWKSLDGGETWTEITRAKGLPQTGLIGKIGVAASPAKAGRVWALIEAVEDPGLYRSDDFGESWSKVSSKQELRYRPFYYMHIYADPQDPETVYIANLGFWKSTDGGRNWDSIPTPHGDNHGLWIDPRNNQRMIQSNDGGANISFNGGATFSTIYNQLTSQFYNICTDNQFPYRVYGTQQDNSSVSVPSNTIEGIIPWADCYAAGTGESGFIVAHPEDSNIVYVGAVGSSPGGGGALQRYDHRTGHIHLINVNSEAHGGIGPGELKIRFPWTYPILFSPHDSNILYAAGNQVFRTTDEGITWEAISPDLTRNDPEKLKASGGPITKDTSGAEHYCTISTLRESAHEPGVFWAGSDDGLVHLSRDGGATWQPVTPVDLPEWTLIRTLEPSPHDPATCYLAGTRYKFDDPAPYLYKTSDYGAHWTKITGGIPADDYVRVIRTDPAQAGLLYCGTERGIYVSLDDGVNWQRWGANLPITPIYDLVVKENDLVAGTHGRGFWIMDDLTPLHQYVAQDASHQSAASTPPIQLFQPRTTYRILPDLFSSFGGPGEGRAYGLGLGKSSIIDSKKNDHGQLEYAVIDGGKGAPQGAVINFYLAEALAPGTKATLTFLDEAGRVIRRFGPKPATYDTLDEKDKALDPGPWIPIKAGVNRFVWDLRHPGATKLRGNRLAGEANNGRFVLPGTYQVRLTVGDTVLTQSFAVVNDPRVTTPYAVLAEQDAFLAAIYAKLSAVYEGLATLRAVRIQAQGWAERLGSQKSNTTVVTAVNELVQKLDAIETVLIIPGEHDDTFGLSQRMRLNSRLSALIPIVGSADRVPTKQSRALFETYAAQADDQLGNLHALLSDDLEALNSLIQDANIPPIVV
ncbi:MAG: glycosyl hydrolase [Caldilineaceae bacterium]|nr:glycosyl hydrolase [Caldilineaceae bacterium]